MRKLQCESCGGKIDGITLACQSCGMQYMIDDDFNLKVINSHLKWSTIEGMICVPAYLLNQMGEQAVSEITLKEMAQSMAPKLLPFMEFESMFEPRYCEIRTWGRIRVAEPVTTRFGNVAFQMPHIDWRFEDK